MRGRGKGCKEIFLKCIDFTNRLGVCPTCYERKHLSKVDTDAYYCSYCNCTSTIGKDYIIISWYVIHHGRRELRSNKIPSSAPRWAEMLKAIRRHYRRL